MKNSKKAVEKEISKEIKEFMEHMTKKYPGGDIEEYITQNIHEKRRTSIRQSEIAYFKELALSSLGTDKEISFNDAEKGFLEAALIEGKKGFKEYIESLPIEAPINDDGIKFINRGNEKKTL